MTEEIEKQEPAWSYIAPNERPFVEIGSQTDSSEYPISINGGPTRLFRIIHEFADLAHFKCGSIHLQIKQHNNYGLGEQIYRVRATDSDFLMANAKELGLLKLTIESINPREKYSIGLSTACHSLGSEMSEITFHSDTEISNFQSASADLLLKKLAKEIESINVIQDSFTLALPAGKVAMSGASDKNEAARRIKFLRKHIADTWPEPNESTWQSPNEQEFEASIPF